MSTHDDHTHDTDDVPRRLAAPVHHQRRGRGRGRHHRAASRPRSRVPGAERSRQRRGRRCRRHGRQQHARRDEPEHRRALRRGHGAARRAHRPMGPGSRAGRAGRRSATRRQPANRPGLDGLAGLGHDEGAAGRQHAVPGRGRRREPPEVRGRGAAHPQVRRLPPDVRAAEGHRRGHRRHARSHARRDRVGGHGPRQARVRAEADGLVASPSRGTWPGAPPRRRCRRSAATSGTRTTRTAAAWTTSPPASSAT